MPSIWARPESEQRDKATPLESTKQNQEILMDRDGYTEMSDRDNVLKEIDSSPGSESDSGDPVAPTYEEFNIRSGVRPTSESPHAFALVFGMMAFALFAPILLFFPATLFAIMAPILVFFPAMLFVMMAPLLFFFQAICFAVFGILPMILFCIPLVLFLSVVFSGFALLFRNILDRMGTFLGQAASRIPRTLLSGIQSIKARTTALIQRAKLTTRLTFIKAFGTARTFFRPRGMIYQPPGTMPWNRLPASHIPEHRVGLQNSWPASGTTSTSHLPASRTHRSNFPQYQNAGLRKYLDPRAYRRHPGKVFGIGLGIGLGLGYAGLLSKNKSDKESGNKDK